MTARYTPQRGEVMAWFYDVNGQMLGFELNGVPYFYVRNLQGDVVKVVNAGGEVVARYEFDAWGNILHAEGELAHTNPITYRGYYKDWVTGLYYLQSRYYDPMLRRFISADVYLDTGVGILGTNPYVYCNNDPVNHIDPEGFKTQPNHPNVIVTQAAPPMTAVGPRPAWVSATAAPPVPPPVRQEQNFSPQIPVPVVNHVNRTHVTTPSTTIVPGHLLVGSIETSTTATTLSPGSPEPAFVFSYFDTSADTFAIGVGIGDFEAGVGVNTENMNAFAGIQLTPRTQGEVSVGVDGVGVTFRVGGNNTANLEIQIGWLGPLAGFAVAGAMMVLGPGAMNLLPI